MSAALNHHLLKLISVSLTLTVQGVSNKHCLLAFFSLLLFSCFIVCLFCVFKAKKAVYWLTL